MRVERLRKSVLGAVGQSQQVSSGRALSMSQQLVVWRHRACESERRGRIWRHWAFRWRGDNRCFGGNISCNIITHQSLQTVSFTKQVIDLVKPSKIVLEKKKYFKNAQALNNVITVHRAIFQQVSFSADRQVYWTWGSQCFKIVPCLNEPILLTVKVVGLL